MPNGGLSLKHYMNAHIMDGSDQKRSESAKKLFFNMHNLFEGLIQFKKNDYINLDIKDENILYKESENRMNFIDFGLAAPLKNIHHNLEAVATAGYFVLPLDFCIFTPEFSAILNNTDYPIDYKVRSLRAQMKSMYSNPRSSYNHIERILSPYSLLYKQFVANKIPDLIRNFIEEPEKTRKDYFNKIGVFCMGLVLIKIWVHYTGEKWSAPIITPFFDELTELITNMLKPYYKDRYSPEQAYAHFKMIYAKYNDIRTLPTLPYVSPPPALPTTAGDGAAAYGSGYGPGAAASGSGAAASGSGSDLASKPSIFSPRPRVPSKLSKPSIFSPRPAPRPAPKPTIAPSQPSALVRMKNWFANNAFPGLTGGKKKRRNKTKHKKRKKNLQKTRTKY